MKTTQFKYLALSALFASAVLFTGCEDDDPLSAGDGDPLLENVINLDVNVSGDLTAGEGNIYNFAVTIPQSFASDAAVSARITLDNGNVADGSATVAAGATSGTGTLVMPSDDGFFPEGLKSENGAVLRATGILLDELEEGNAYTVTSNAQDVSVLSRTEDIDGGVAYVLDWIGYQTIDLDIIFRSVATGDVVTGSAGGPPSRFEAGLFENNDQPDGDYLIEIRNYSSGTTPAYAFNMTLPDNSLVSIEGVTFDPAITGGTFARDVIGLLTKTTDAASGVTSYTVRTE